MRDLFCDLETYCVVPIKDGTHRYAEQAEVMLWSYALEDSTVKVWDKVNSTIHWQEDLGGVWVEAPCKGMPADLDAALGDPEILVWFQNGGQFDFPVLKHAMPQTYARIGLDRMRDTMVQAFAHALPGSLDKLGEVLGMTEDKRKLADGRRLVQLFCKPRPDGSRATKQTHPKEWQRFVEYAAGDITTMREVRRLVPSWNYKGKQVELWHLDLVINNRGFAVDLDLAEAAVRAAEKTKADLAVRTQEATDGAVQAATQRDALLKHILEIHGVDLPDMRADTLERRMQDPDLPEPVRELLGLRLQASMNSVSKFKTLLRGVNRDGRLRGCMQFRGASRTGRWGHRMFQPGNLPRPDMSHAQIELAVQALKTDCADLVFDNVMRAISNTIRSVIVAPPGRKLVVADLSNIEGRVAAWLTGEEWKLQAFRDFDNGIGHDLYILAYAKSFGVDPATVPKKGPERQIGKVCIAEGQLVLTDCGLVPIENVTTEMKVWDGIAWVEHDGVIFNGIKEVMTYQGLTATPDHMVWIDGSKEPVPLRLAAACGSRLQQCGDGWAPVRLLDRDITGTQVHAGMERPVRAHGVQRLRPRLLDSLDEPGPRYEHDVSSVRASAGYPPVVVAASRFGAAAVHEPERRGLAALRREGHRVQVPVSESRGPVRDQNTRAPGYIQGDRPGGQQRSLRTGESALGHPRAEPTQQLPCPPTGVVYGMGFEGMAVSRNHCPSNASVWDDARADIGGGVVGGEGQAEKLARHPHQVAVYDIVNAGPRHRFTVSGVLVANCELMFQYQGGVGAWVTGAATYGIDLDKMTEQVWDTLPQWSKDEARDFLDWMYAQAEGKLKKRLQVLDLKVVRGEIHPEEAAPAQMAIETEIEAAKLKARHGLPEKTFIACDAIKRLWRKAHPAISSYWKQLEDTVREAIQNPGVTLPCRKLKIRRDGAWLRIGLPSGRALCYPNPKIEKDGTITYAGLNQYTRQWGRISTYGGKLLEGPTQAVACDHLAEPMPDIDEAGYAIVMHVHDELVTEAPDEDRFNAEDLSHRMCADLGWNAGLPLAAVGFETYRYRKE